MKPQQHIIRLAALLVLAGAGAAAMAHGNVSCPAVPTEEKRPQMDLQRKLESEGWKIRVVKNYNNCYEVYGFDEKGPEGRGLLPLEDLRARVSRGRGTHEVIPVWDALVRSLHWLLVASVLTTLVSGHVEMRWFDAIHHSAGYLAAGVVLTRVAWGFVGSRYARFGQFVRGPRETWDYALQVRGGEEPRYVGHNPLGGAMVLALLATVASASLSGFLYTTDWLWGYEWLSTLHEVLSWLLIGLVLLHPDRRHRDQPAPSREPGAGDVARRQAPRRGG